MALVGTVKQQPSEVQDYDIDFGQWLPTNDVISSVTLTVAPAMTTPPSYAVSGTRVKVWVYAGGVDGQTYKINVLASTTDGRAKEAELRVKVKET